MPLPDTVQEQVNKALDYDFDGIIVYVDKAGETPELYSAGVRNRLSKEPIKADGLFKIASISKLYVAAATAKLIASDSLALDKTVAQYFPELENRIENADKITLKMLLQHRSGMPDFIKEPEYPWAAPPPEVSESLKLALDKPAHFDPDEKYEYCNTNYLLIGNILDKTLGYPHQEYIKKNILLPLDLHNTFGYLSEVDSNKVVSGYDTNYGEMDVKMLDFVPASGSMLATAEDVGIFLRALNDGSLLTEKEQAVYSSIYEYEHTGLLPGYQSIARYHKDIDTVVIQFTNQSGGHSWVMSELVYGRIIKILKG